MVVAENMKISLTRRGNTCGWDSRKQLPACFASRLYDRKMMHLKHQLMIFTHGKMFKCSLKRDTIKMISLCVYTSLRALNFYFIVLIAIQKQFCEIVYPPAVPGASLKLCCLFHQLFIHCWQSL